MFENIYFKSYFSSTFNRGQPEHDKLEQKNYIAKRT